MLIHSNFLFWFDLIHHQKLKEQFEQAQHQRRLREIELGNLGKEGTASIQGEVRKAIQEQSAMNQSQLIEQRKDRRGPLGEEQNISQQFDINIKKIIFAKIT